MSEREPSTLGAEIHAALGQYVYALEDPRDGLLFYVGRGVGDRVLHHTWAALASEEPGAKLERIRAIHTAGFSPRAYILRRRIGQHSAARKWWQCRPVNRNPAPNLLLAEAQGIVRGAWTIASPPHRLLVTWQDLDERRRAFLGPRDEFQPFEACCFDGKPDAEWAVLVGRHTRYPVLPRAYGAAFRYLNC